MAGAWRPRVFGPRPADAHEVALKLDRARVLFQAGKSGEAVALLRRAILSDPHCEEAIVGLVILCSEGGWPEVLAAGLRDAYRGGNRGEIVLANLVLVALGAGDRRAMGQFFGEFREHYPHLRKIGPYTVVALERRLASGAAAPGRRPPAGRRRAPRPAAPLSPLARSPGPGPSPHTALSPPPMPAPDPTPPVSAGLALPRPQLGPIGVSIEVEETGLAARVTAGAGVDWPRLALRVEAFRLAAVNNVDELLCLPQLRGVQEFWFQIETVRKVLKRFRGRALLCDEVGLGKTVEAGMVIKEYLLRGLAQSVLVLVPPALVGQWQDELAGKFDLSFATTADPSRRLDPDAFWARESLVIASLSLAKSASNRQRVMSRQFDLIVVDEAHHLRNSATEAWKLVNGLKSRFMLLLTATPLQNNLLELYNLITLLKPGQLRTPASFLKEFVSRKDPTVPLNEQKLRELLSEVMIRNTRALAGLKLPPRHATTIVVEPAPAEEELYARLSALVRAHHRAGQGNGALDRLTLRLLQSEAGSSPAAVAKTLAGLLAVGGEEDALRSELRALAALAGGLRTSTKVARLVDILASTREQTIVFVSYLETLSFVSRELEARGMRPVLFHGRMSAREKDAAVERFRSGERVLVATEVGGEGRNLQFCHRMVNLDLPWNPMRIEQRIGRLHRIGQESEIEILNLCARGSVEDHLLGILDRKINMFELVIGEIDMILGRLADERDFSERVLDTWAGAATDEEAATGFEQLSRELLAAKQAYERTKALDESLFGEDFEVLKVPE